MENYETGAVVQLLYPVHHTDGEISWTISVYVYPVYHTDGEQHVLRVGPRGPHLEGAGNRRAVPGTALHLLPHGQHR